VKSGLNYGHDDSRVSTLQSFLSETASDLCDRVAIVTGASRGIGRAIAVELASKGHDVLINYRTEEQCAEHTAEVVRSMGRQALVYRADVTQRAQVTAMLEVVLKEFGRLDTFINNVGLLDQKPFSDIDDQEWETLIDVNLNSAFICTQEAAPRISDGGCIVNVSSIGGQIGGPKAPHYAAAKGALLTFTKSSARLLAPRIRVNAVAPGFIRTDMFEHIQEKSGQLEEEIVDSIPLQRLGEPEDVAGAVGFLVSTSARYITGHTLNINGGILMS
jgi:3-oxoacyl-[acyl-carrier protein] reductase